MEQGNDWLFLIVWVVYVVLQITGNGAARNGKRRQMDGRLIFWKVGGRLNGLNSSFPEGFEE